MNAYLQDTTEYGPSTAAYVFIQIGMSFMMGMVVYAISYSWRNRFDEWSAPHIYSKTLFFIDALPTLLFHGGLFCMLAYINCYHLPLLTIVVSVIYFNCIATRHYYDRLAQPVDVPDNILARPVISKNM